MVLWLLTFSTIFSLRVEQWMVPSVTTVEPKFSFANRKGHAPLDCLFETETGSAVFTVYEGTMWDAGTRARALQPDDYTVTPEGYPAHKRCPHAYPAGGIAGIVALYRLAVSVAAQHTYLGFWILCPRVREHIRGVGAL